MSNDRSDEEKKTRDRPWAPVQCRRLDRRLTIAEHDACPYCFGEEAQIRTGDHGVFCDFKPGVDPISFGFPETHGRYRWPEVPPEPKRGKKS